MFQSFATTARPEQGPPRLARLREALAAAGLTGFIVPRADAHQGEYVAPADARLAWLTGFTGSAGFCIVLPDRAGIFVDGRYRTQLRSQVDLARFTPVDWPETRPGDWLRAALPEGGRIGYDPWLHTAREIETLERTLAGSAITLVAGRNLVDAVWQDRPPPPEAPAFVYPAELAGQTHDEKRARIAETLRAAGQRAAVLTLPDSIAWLLNIRGADIPRIPVMHAFAILYDSAEVTLFAAPEKLDAALRSHLGPQVRLCPPDALLAALRTLAGPVRVDPATAPKRIFLELAGAGVEIAPEADPCLLPKARKTAAEIRGMEAAHLRDGAAVARFLAWLDAQPADAGLTEIDLVRRLEDCRRATGALRDISFDTICGAGPNGAIIHYRVTEESNRRLEPGEVVVLDSGGQYLDGTTDITRTIAIGTPGPEERAAFTRVLQGMIAVSRLRWPKGLAGQHLDCVARTALWQAGQDYDHGTGHGVGCYLSVHEGPQRLSRLGEVPLEPGMVLSNEPGYYREGAFGIRIENLVVVEKAPALPGGDAHREMLCFRTLTLVPIDRRLIDADALGAAERAWLDAYHRSVAERIGPLLEPAARRWLDRATRPL
ncbi:aminopeptidase P family protein [Albidovulum sp.]